MIYKLSDVKIKKISEPGMYADGGGLYLKAQTSKNSKKLNKSWMFRWGAKGANTIGLGSFSVVALADARTKAIEFRRQISHDIDPRLERDRKKSELLKLNSKKFTFQEAAIKYIATHKASWRSAKHAQQWENTLKTYVFPKIGKLPCADITKHQILAILEPIWINKHETASRVRGRIESIFYWAIAMEYRNESNPAVLKGCLQPLLPSFKKRKNVKHHKAMSYQDIPKFFASIKDDPSVSARALVMDILTATRTSETTNATWDEFDLDKKVWTIPKERMKREIEHRIPLANQVVEILEHTDRDGSDLLFFGIKSKKKAISNMTMLKYLKRKEGCEDYTVHGFRSAFRDWAAEQTNHQREVCEHALAHGLADQTEAAYQRGDCFDKRAKLMQDWADFCFGLVVDK